MNLVFRHLSIAIDRANRVLSNADSAINTFIWINHQKIRHFMLARICCATLHFDGPYTRAVTRTQKKIERTAYAMPA